MQNYNGPSLGIIHVRTRPGYRSKGLLQAGGRILNCALGRSGIGTKTGEGDGITPRGRFLLLAALIRTDKCPLRRGRIDYHTIRPEDGWCDATGDRNYNRPVDLPYAASHEKLWRDDHLYDVALVMDFNVSQRMSVGGSAIFFHLAREGYSATEGCVAISRRDMLWLLPRIGPDTVMLVE